MASPLEIQSDSGMTFHPSSSASVISRLKSSGPVVHRISLRRSNVLECILWGDDECASGDKGRYWFSG